jgi:spore germination cell wall hydrolase CwlJ-like protein
MVINTHHEARGESLVGQVAINHVVRNRANSSTYKSQKIKKEILKYRAFSWTNNEKKRKEALCLEKVFYVGVKNLDIKRLKKFEKYKSSMISVALSIISKDITNGSNHYYNPRLASPKWAESGYKKTIGNHDFHVLSYGTFRPGNAKYAVYSIAQNIRNGGLQ